MLLDVEGIVKRSDELFREHYGEVVSNADPKKLGRIKVKIEFLLELSTDDLPWCYPHQFSPTMFYVPQVGEKVKVKFRGGDIYHPEYVGYFHSSANHDAEFDTDYPDSFGIHKSGFKFKYNMKAELFEIAVPNGSSFVMNKDGDMLCTVKKDFKVNTDGKIEMISKADALISSDGKVTITGKGGVEITSDGEAKFAGKAGTKVGDDSSQTMVNGTMVLLAGGGVPVAVLGSTAMGIGNLGAPVVASIISGSSKVQAPS